MHYATDSALKLEGTTARYTIETQGSSLTVRAFATGLLASIGHNPTITAPDIEGEILFDTEDLTRSSLRLAIRAESLSCIDKISDKDRAEINRRMHEEVLESDSYAEVVYECSRASASKLGESQYWAALNGDLTLHGVNRPQPVSARISVNGDTIRATGDCSILLSQYDIKPVSALGGAVRLKDELKLSFEVVARKQA